MMYKYTACINNIFFSARNYQKLKYKTTVLCRYFSNGSRTDKHMWREAASLMIVSPANNAEELNFNSAKSNGKHHTDYNILMVKRSQGSSFMANAFVFPGGLVDIADFSPNWWTVFEKTGFSKGNLEKFCSGFTGERPPLITDSCTLKSVCSLKGNNYLPTELGLRIAALRETFEESGILLLKSLAENSTMEQFICLGKNDTEMWQRKVHKDANYFLELCQHLQMCPDIWSLYEWSNWLTPPYFENRRYDTMFYFCCLPKKPDVLIDSGEVTVMWWCSPEEILTKYRSSDIILYPPQVYECSRLLSVKTYLELSDFSRKRQYHGSEWWMPVSATAVDGSVHYLPGDGLYPKYPDFKGIEEPKEIPCTLEEHRKNSSQIHRMEMQVKNSSIELFCNIKPGCNHLMPLTST